MIRLAPLLLAGLLPFAAFAQDSAPAPQSPAAPAPAAAAPAPTVNVEQAYRREYALLEAQKRELTARVNEIRQQTAAQKSRLEGEVAALENRVFAERAEAETATEELTRIEQAAFALAENAGFVDATLEQARSTLAGFGNEALSADDFAARDELAKLQGMFEQGIAQLGQLAEIRREVRPDLARELARLHRSARRLIWLNPLLRFGGFEAKAAGIRAMLPHVDEFRTCHSLNAMADLCQALAAGAGDEADPRRFLKEGR